MTFKGILSISLAFLQFIGITLGIIPFSREIDYGGSEIPVTCVKEPVTLIDGGTSDYVIIKGAHGSKAETMAANAICNYLEKISSVRLEIADDSRSPQEHEIIIGLTNRDVYGSIPIDSLGNEGFTMKAVGEKLVITGAAERGTVYGVYTFLEEQLGCRWFSPTFEVVPENKTVIFSAELNNTQIPDFSIRRNSPSGSTAEFRAKSKTNVSFSDSDEEFGGAYSFALWDVTLTKLVPDSLFDFNPTIFAYDRESGVRNVSHVCMSSADALRYAIVNAEKYIDENTSDAGYIHIGQKDNSDYCECEKCTDAYEKYGSIAAPTIIFANELHKALLNDGYDIIVTFYAYIETAEPPTKAALRCDSGVIPVVCGSHTACHCHPYTECGVQDKAENDNFIYRFSDHSDTKFSDDIIGWKAVADKIYIYDYTVNFMNNQLFFADFATIQPNAAFLMSQGVEGYVYNCGDGHEAAFNELRNYLRQKIMWNTDCDIEYHMNDFLSAWYGEAASKYIRSFIDYMTGKITASAHATDTDWAYQSAFYNTCDRIYLDGLWKKALAADATDEQHYNIEKSEICWRFTKACQLMGEFFPLNPARAKNQEKLYDDMVTHSINRVTSFSYLPEKENINFMFSSPQDWR